MSVASDHMVNWLVRAIALNGAVRERYKVSTQTWNESIRPDCNAESMVSFYRMYQRTGNLMWRDRARNSWHAFNGMQYADGAWKFSDVNDIWGRAKCINDIAEVILSLYKCADIDDNYAELYRAAALRSVDYLLNVQLTNGAWEGNEFLHNTAPLWIGHGMSALSFAYSRVNSARQTAINDSVARAYSWLVLRTATDGHALTSVEMDGANEAWRPPSSDTAICIRGLAMAERYLTHVDPNWGVLRRKMHNWLDPLIHVSGAIRNGYGIPLTGADHPAITDHVYTTKFAIEAYRESYHVDKNLSFHSISKGLTKFVESNLYFSANHDANGILRGAYDLVAGNWDTSEVAQNIGEEGGGDMIYSGWSNAPISTLLMVESARRRHSFVFFD